MESVGEMLARYGHLLAQGWWLPLVCFAVGLILPFARRPRVTRWALPLLIVGLGIAFAHLKTAMYDDAYYSFRCAHNLIAGNGLVYNIGERLEVYTNFLWTIWLALWMRLTGFNAPFVSIVFTLACFLGNLLIVYRLGLLLSATNKIVHYWPLAALLLAGQNSFASFASTGLETMAGSLLVNVGLLFLLTAADTRRAFLAGFFFILATLNRLDHSLFYVAGAFALLWMNRGALTALLRGRWSAARAQGLDRLLAYALALVPLLAYLGWKLAYYGSLLPNTFFAKSAYIPYAYQGLRYLAAFYLGSHLWVALLLMLVWFLRPTDDDRVRTMKTFTLAAFVLWHAYILWVGGDYLYGRFMVVFMPLALLAAENLTFTGLRRKWVMHLTAALLAATACGVQLITPGTGDWCMMDETTHSPDSVMHLYRERDQHELRFACLLGAGFAPKILVDGRDGYTVALPAVDRWGLTDPQLGRRPLTQRTCPGHEKYASLEDLVARDVRLSALPLEIFTDRHQTVNDLHLPCGEVKMLFYDRAWLDRLQAALPEVRFVDFPAFLDEYIAALPGKTPPEVAQDLRDFRRYYFAVNDDPPRLQVLIDYLTAKNVLTPSP
ncbi:MAG TPA: hypothetical protein PKW95_02260 [bacterium]|nr:hypothetical protein [bacterium]